MRLEVTRRSDLAVRVLHQLARAEGRTKGSALADAVATTPGFVAHVMAPLVRRRWVSSEPGPSGGYRLEVDLAEVSLLDVIEAVEGPTDTDRCVLADRTCDAAGTCALHVPWRRARAQLLDELAATAVGTVPA